MSIEQCACDECALVSDNFLISTVVRYTYLYINFIVLCTTHTIFCFAMRQRNSDHTQFRLIFVLFVADAGGNNSFWKMIPRKQCNFQ